MLYRYNGTLFTLKRRKILAYAVMWMKLEDTERSEVSQSQKDKRCTIPFTGGAQSGQSHGGRKCRVAAGAGRVAWNWE